MVVVGRRRRNSSSRPLPWLQLLETALGKKSEAAAAAGSSEDEWGQILNDGSEIKRPLPPPTVAVEITDFPDDILVSLRQQMNCLFPRGVGNRHRTSFLSEVVSEPVLEQRLNVESIVMQCYRSEREWHDHVNDPYIEWSLVPHPSRYILVIPLENVTRPGLPSRPELWHSSEGPVGAHRISDNSMYGRCVVVLAFVCAKFS